MGEAESEGDRTTLVMPGGDNDSVSVDPTELDEKAINTGNESTANVSKSPLFQKSKPSLFKIRK